MGDGETVGMRQNTRNLIWSVGLASVIAVGLSTRPVGLAGEAGTFLLESQRVRLSRPIKVQDLSVDGITLGANVVETMLIFQRSQGWRKFDETEFGTQIWSQAVAPFLERRVAFRRNAVQFIEGATLSIRGQSLSQYWTVPELREELRRLGFTRSEPVPEPYVAASTYLREDGRSVEVVLSLTVAENGRVARVGLGQFENK